MPTKHRPGTASLTLTFALVAAGCGTNPTLLKALPAMTSIFSGAACYALFPGKSRAVVTALCALGGTVIGAKMKQALTEAEQPKMVEATYETLETRKPQEIKLDRNKTIRTEIVSAAPAPAPAPPPAAPAKPTPGKAAQPARPAAANVPAPAAPVVATADNGCVTVRQTVLVADAPPSVENVTACRGVGGQWVV